MGKQVAARLKQNNFNIPNGGVAQLGEHLPCKQGVKSSNLSISTRSFPKEMITAERSAAGTLKTEYRQANID